MTTLSDILIDGRLPADFNAPGYGLVYGADVYNLIMSIQTEDMQHRIGPVATADGRYITCADVLTEAVRGIMKPVFDQIPPETAMVVEVVPWDDAVALLPVPEPLAP